MRFHVLATDYDGTIATHGVVDDATIAALERVRASGRKVVLVTGRELDDLAKVFPRFDVFDRIVAENGAVLHRPDTRETRALAEAPPPSFAATLRARGVAPLSVGQVIVAAWEPHENTVLDVIREQGLELQVIFNKGAVMVLPSGVNKAFGFAAALEDLGLSAHNAVGVGDAENDHALLAQCECGVAVANALPALKERADWVTPLDHGAGVQQLCDALIADDLNALVGRLPRHELTLGTTDEDQPLTIPPHGAPILVAGTSGGGKSTLSLGLLEQLADRGYQICVVDPEGDYTVAEDAAVLGDVNHPPTVTAAMELLNRTKGSVVLNMLALRMPDRPTFFTGLLTRLHELRSRTGRPHWILVDEAHHVLPTPWQPSVLPLPRELAGMLLVTVHPEHVSPEVLHSVALVLVIGASPRETLAGFAAARGIAPPDVPEAPLARGEALAWVPGEPTVVRLRVREPRTERRRHVRKYATGELEPDRSFWFRGPDDRLKLRAQNLQLFLQVADGVDDETWIFHLRQGDYSRWFREAIKDPELAAAAEAIEGDPALPPETARVRLREAVESRYTAPA